MLGFGDAGEFDLDEAWKPRTPNELYKLPLGISEHGEPLWLDLKTCLAGIGIFGEAGSGKSELMRSMLLGLAASHPSTAVSFVLLAHRGTHTFRGLESLPHTSLCADLDQRRETDPDRLLAALPGELHRRAEHLDTARRKDFLDHERARLGGEDLESLPLTLVAIESLPDVLRNIRTSTRSSASSRGCAAAWDCNSSTPRPTWTLVYRSRI